VCSKNRATVIDTFLRYSAQHIVIMMSIIRAIISHGRVFFTSSTHAATRRTIARTVFSPRVANQLVPSADTNAVRWSLGGEQVLCMAMGGPWLPCSARLQVSIPTTPPQQRHPVQPNQPTKPTRPSGKSRSPGHIHSLLRLRSASCFFVLCVSIRSV
jgi:hypothetical protein